MADDKVIYSFEKNSLEEVRFSLNSFKGKRYLDIRIYYKSLEDGTLKPSKKGITLAPSFIDELEEGIKRLKNELNKEE